MRLKMSKLILAIFAFFSFNSFSLDRSELGAIVNEKTPENLDVSLLDREISQLYQKGAVLLYDCRSSHWVCTGELEMNRCFREKRKAFLDKERVYPCAFIHKFKTEKECYAKQQVFVNRSIIHDFCQNTNP